MQATDVYLSEIVEVPDGCRVAHIHFNEATFGCASRRDMYVCVVYDATHNFNITPPRMRTTDGGRVVVPIDVMWELDDRGDEDAELNKLAFGRTAEIMRKWRDDIPASWPDRLRRIGWLRGPTHIHSDLVHPDYNRRCSLLELSALCGHEHAAETFEDLQQPSTASMVWVMDQIAKHEAGGWKSSDWESRYDATHGQWVGRSTPHHLHKVFDLREYRPRKFLEPKYADTLLPRGYQRTHIFRPQRKANAADTTV